MSEKRRRGRPTLAAQSLDGALHAAFLGRSPPRPRNVFERQAARKPKGRPGDANGPIPRAAELTLYLHVSEGLPFGKALSKALAALASEVWQIRQIDGKTVASRLEHGRDIDPANVRRYIQIMRRKRKIFLSSVVDEPLIKRRIKYL